MTTQPPSYSTTLTMPMMMPLTNTQIMPKQITALVPNQQTLHCPSTHQPTLTDTPAVQPNVNDDPHQWVHDAFAPVFCSIDNLGNKLCKILTTTTQTHMALLAALAPANLDTPTTWKHLIKVRTLQTCCTNKWTFQDLGKATSTPCVQPKICKPFNASNTTAIRPCSTAEQHTRNVRKVC